MRTKTWIVTSTKMDKTAVITVSGYKTDEKYKKRYKISKKFYAHDETNSCKEWDFVNIVEVTKPLSKLKRWKIQDNLWKDRV